MRCLLLIAVAAVAVAACVRPAGAISGTYTEAALRDKVTALPGAPAGVKFNIFSGYLPVDPTNGRNIFYFFTESQSNPDSDPLVAWTNGGPGCSGMLSWTEQGPFSPKADGTLQLNPHSWNLRTNFVALEAPAGVGFSYSNTPSDYITGDRQTSADFYKAIQLFLDRFPHLRTNKFVFTSESYGGHYVPWTARTIIDAQGSGDTPVNFYGVMVGNPYTNPLENNIGMYGTWGGHALISRETAAGVDKNCLIPDPTSKCNEFLNRANNEVGDLDPYGLDFPICTSNGGGGMSSVSQSLRLLNFTRDRTMLPAAAQRALARAERGEAARQPRRVEAGKPGRSVGGDVPSYPYDPCRGDYLSTYLNREDVKTALHANTSIHWSQCSSIVQYNQTDGEQDMVPLWLDILKKRPDLKIVVYSGDDDSVCGTLGTLTWAQGSTLGLEVAEKWTPWTDKTQNVGGYVTKMKPSLSLVTVHSAGHEVPQFQPERASELIDGFFSGRWFA